MTPSELATPAPLEHRKVLIAFSGLVLAMLLAALDSTIVSTALPTIVGELGGLDHLAWVVTGYLLAQTIVTPIYGKLGDLYGRKRVLQSAVALFLIGSAVCGLSRSMTQLILCRALQGLGGGGLTVTTQAVVGDIVPPRDRGRYQGIFGAVYGLASIAGPLLGGYFTTHWSWRWIFYINLPLGIAAMVVLASTLPAQTTHVRHAIDYTGAALLAVVLSVVTILADVGGTTYAWASPMVIGMIVVAAAALLGFLLAERGASEPVLPLRLFRGATFSLTSIVGLIVGFALFGSVTYFPLYLQVVRGVSPTASGLQMLPMMAGMLVTSILSGQLISRSGRYKLFPIAGTLVMTVGLVLLGRLTPQSSNLASSSYLLVLGVGLGMVMQVLVIAVQNDVEYRDLGVATSGATLFRLVGGSLGTAILGAVFASELTKDLARRLPAAAGGAASIGGMSMRTLARMTPAMRAAYAAAVTSALDVVFMVAAVVCAVGFIVCWFLPERPLRTTVAATAGDAGHEAGEAFARPSDSAAVAAQLYAALAQIADRDVQRRHIAAIVQRAGETLTPLAAYLLVRMEREPGVDPLAVGARIGVPSDRVRAALAELRHRGLLETRPPTALTDAGCDVLERLREARREHLAALAAEWNPAESADVGAYLRDAAVRIIPNVERERLRRAS
ncbi:MAG TPA: MFS transporter [Gemmatimonadaceae bacterium]|nr:MFS transporter [Gemmatimonadaceae bacterium]